MKRYSIPALAILLVSICIPTVAPAGEVVLSELISRDSLRNATGGDDLTHEFSQEPEQVKVTVLCKLNRGRFDWRVEDPAGNVLWKESRRAKSSKELSSTFPGQKGEWRIVIDYENAKGRYEIKMEAVR